MPLEPHQARPCWTARPAPSCRAAHQQARRARAAGAREARRRRGGRGGRRRLGAVAGLARVLERLVLRKVLVEAVVQLRARAGGVTSAQGNRALRRWRTRATAWHGRMPPPCSRSPQGASAPANALSRTRPGQTSLALDVRGRTAGAQHRNSTRLTGAAIAMRVGHARATHVLADLAGAVHPRDAEPGRPGVGVQVHGAVARRPLPHHVAVSSRHASSMGGAHAPGSARASAAARPRAGARVLVLGRDGDVERVGENEEADVGVQQVAGQLVDLVELGGHQHRGRQRGCARGAPRACPKCPYQYAHTQSVPIRSNAGRRSGCGCRELDEPARATHSPCHGVSGLHSP